MNSQPNHQLLEQLQQTSPTESFVNICISTDNINEILPVLLTQQIPFSMSSMALKTKEPTKITDKTVHLETKQESKSKGKKNKVEYAFHKYMVEGIERTPPKTNEIAAELGISDSTFNSQFKGFYGKPFFQIYMEKRMEHAAKLLKQGYKAVDVSKRIGYGEKSCIKFNKMFQKHFGMTPKKYQMSFK